MSHVYFVSNFIALCAFVFVDVLLWRDALMAPPSQRRILPALAVLGLVLITVGDIVFG